MNEISQNSDGVSPPSGVSDVTPEPPKKGRKWKFWILSVLGLALLALLILNPDLKPTNLDGMVAILKFQLHFRHHGRPIT